MMTNDSRTPLRPRLAIRRVLLAVLCCGPLGAWGAESGIQGNWRFTHALNAPWGTALPDSANLAGQTLTITAERITGPNPFNCAGLRSRLAQLPPEGLFQGGLPAPAITAAYNLGLAQFPVATSVLTCDSGVFDFHHGDTDTLLVGLDNRVWTLSRAPGALAAADSPEGVIERLLEAHFSADMSFSPTALATKRAFLSADLWQAIQAYFAKPQPKNEAPTINGDPFTDSQEYPTRFAVQRARIEGDAAQVEVVFSDASRSVTLLFELTREAGAWLLDEITYPEGISFSGLLE